MITIRLNPDCIRDILLVVEENSSFSNYVTTKDFSKSVKIKNYDAETLLYHIRQARDAGLLTDVKFTLGGYFLIKDLSPKGHEFLANIRKDDNWSKTKAIATKVGSLSLNALTSISASVISAAINQHLGL